MWGTEGSVAVIIAVGLVNPCGLWKRSFETKWRRYGVVTHALNRYINHAFFVLISARFRAIAIKMLIADLYE